MSFYNTDEYEFSFAQRTIKNLEFIQKRVEEEKAQGKKDQEIQDAFEVTQLINSFIGLLIIPRQKCYNHLIDDARFPRGSDAEKLLERISTDRNKCKDTYRETKYDSTIGDYVPTDEYEKITPKKLALRLRNAVSHDRLIIQPLFPGKNGVITGIEFSDRPQKRDNKYGEYFKLLLTIEETEILVKALSELLLSHYPQKKIIRIDKTICNNLFLIWHFPFLHSVSCTSTAFKQPGGYRILSQS